MERIGGLAFSTRSGTQLAVVPVEAAARSQSKSKVDVELKVVLPLWCLDEECSASPLRPKIPIRSVSIQPIRFVPEVVFRAFVFI